VFGYHEMFHAPVILTAVTPLRVIAVYVPRARDEGSVQATIRSTFRPEEEEWLRR
jgi:hypothetical protein